MNPFIRPDCSNEAFALALGLAFAPAAQIGEIAVVDAANDSLFVQGNFSEPLTTFAVGGWHKQDLAAELNFLAPAVPVSPRFEYAAWTNADQFQVDDDDRRAIGADFKEVRFNSSKVNARTYNRGLKIRLDKDQVLNQPNYQQTYVGLLMRRIQRNALIRVYAALAAAAVNTNRSWSGGGTSVDPDSDVVGSLITSANLSGLKPNKIVYGDTAWLYRRNGYSLDANQGRWIAAAYTPEQVAASLMVEGVYVSKSRYQSSASAKSETLGALAYLFYQTDSPSVEDPSHIKRFVSNTESGGPVRVFVQQVTEKLVDIGIEHYEYIATTYATGVRKQTIS